MVGCIECRRLGQFVSDGIPRFFWWAGCATSGALVLHWRDHNIMRRRHGPVVWEGRSRRRKQLVTHGTKRSRMGDYKIG
jgi:hypothetical protein